MMTLFIQPLTRLLLVTLVWAVNSLSPAAQRQHFYLTAVTWLVLRKNAAVECQTLATRIHRLIERSHPEENA